MAPGNRAKGGKVKHKIVKIHYNWMYCTHYDYGEAYNTADIYGKGPTKCDKIEKIDMSPDTQEVFFRVSKGESYFDVYNINQVFWEKEEPCQQ
jgi:hypothetical protein